tara:strand:+ start:1643 stop:3379 length:1737 start_codon:yes stop_codon:yes gene_type:complete
MFALLNSLSIWLVGSLITSIMPTSIDKKLNDNSTFWDIENIINPTGEPIQALKILCLMLILTFLLKNIFFYINNISLTYVQTKMIVDIRNKLFNHLSRLPLSFYDKNKTGELSSIAINDVTNMRIAFTQSVQNLINQPISISVMIIMLFIINFKLTLIMLIAAPLSFGIVFLLVGSIKRRAKRSSVQVAGLMNILQEMLTSIRIVKSFVSEKKELLKFKTENNKFFVLIMNQEKLRFLTTPINEMIGVVLGVIILWVGGIYVLETSSNQSLEADKFIKFIIYLFAMLQPARKLTSVASTMQQGIASAERVFSILDVEIYNQNEDQLIDISKFKKSISFNKVSFSYNETIKKAINNITFNIKKGQFVAFVGESGAGKSTSLDLLMRFYNYQEGEIKIDNIELKKIKKTALRNQIGVIPQDTILFNDTILNNISYGSEEICIDKAKEAAGAANAIHFINKLDYGFDSIIGEKGTKLSGGQKQRLSIARAIYKNPKILIMDEATSSLDSESEKKVQQAINNLVKDRTVIVIAHRLSTIINADQILVFDDGKIVEKGTHKTLLNKSKIYKKLYEIQFQEDNK